MSLLCEPYRVRPVLDSARGPLNLNDINYKYNFPPNVQIIVCCTFSKRTYIPISGEDLELEKGYEVWCAI